MVQYSNPGRLEFEAALWRPDVVGASTFIAFPFDVVEQFGVKGRVPVAATFDGEPYRGSLTPRANHPHQLLVLGEIQQSLGKGPGDTVHVTLELDTAERTVELDDDVETALQDAGQLAAFRAMAYSHQREYERWITGAKQAETRQRRIAQTAEMVAAGKKLK